MSSDHYLTVNIEPKHLNDAYLVNPDNKEVGLKKIRKPKGSMDHMDWRTLFVQDLVIYIDSQHLPKAMALLDKKQIKQPTKPETTSFNLTPSGYRRGTKKENTARRKKLATVLGLKGKTPFKNWIKQSKELKEAKTDYFGFNENALNPIGEAKEQKIGWNNLILDKNLKKADRIFLAPIDPFTKEIGIKGHTPYSDVLVANSTTELFKLGVENGIGNMGYGVFIIDTKNRTIEKMDLHALNKTTLEEAKIESEKTTQDNFFPSTPTETKKTEKVKPVKQKPQKGMGAEELAKKSIGMPFKGRTISEKDSKDFLQKYVKPLSENYRYKEGSTITQEEKSTLFAKLLDQGLPESGFRDDSNEDSYIKHLLDRGFIQSEKIGHNPETGHAKYKFVVKPEHKEAISLYNQLLSGK